MLGNLHEDGGSRKPDGLFLLRHTADLIAWRAVERDFCIRYPQGLIEELSALVMRGYERSPWGGVELGGVLFGKKEADGVSILTYRPLESEHQYGPSFELSARDIERLERILAESNTADSLKDLVPVGWFHSVSARDFCLAGPDIALHNRVFPELWQVAIVLNRSKQRPVETGFFLREITGALPTQPAYSFTLDDLRAGSPAPQASEGKTAGSPKPPASAGGPPPPRPVAKPKPVRVPPVSKEKAPRVEAAEPPRAEPPRAEPLRTEPPKAERPKAERAAARQAPFQNPEIRDPFDSEPAPGVIARLTAKAENFRQRILYSDRFWEILDGIASRCGRLLRLPWGSKQSAAELRMLDPLRRDLDFDDVELGSRPEARPASVAPSVPGPRSRVTTRNRGGFAPIPDEATPVIDVGLESPRASAVHSLKRKVAAVAAMLGFILLSAVLWTRDKSPTSRAQVLQPVVQQTVDQRTPTEPPPTGLPDAGSSPTIAREPEISTRSAGAGKRDLPSSGALTPPYVNAPNAARETRTQIPGDSRSTSTVTQQPPTPLRDGGNQIPDSTRAADPVTQASASVRGNQFPAPDPVRNSQVPNVARVVEPVTPQAPVQVARIPEAPVLPQASAPIPSPTAIPPSAIPAAAPPQVSSPPLPQISSAPIRTPAPPVGVGGQLQQAALIHRQEPVYPEMARRARVQGSVVLDATVGIDGRLKDLRVLEGPSILQAAAMDAAKQWTYKPAILNGKAVEAQTHLVFTFGPSQTGPPQSIAPQQVSPPPASSQPPVSAPPPTLPAPSKAPPPPVNTRVDPEKAGQIQQATLIHRQEPVYPEMARRARVQGSVVVDATVGTDGKLKDVHVLEGHPLLRSAALEAAKQWTYKPAMLNGVAVEANTHLVFTFGSK